MTEASGSGLWSVCVDWNEIVDCHYAVRTRCHRKEPCRRPHLMRLAQRLVRHPMIVWVSYIRRVPSASLKGSQQGLLPMTSQINHLFFLH